MQWAKPQDEMYATALQLARPVFDSLDALAMFKATPYAPLRPPGMPKRTGSLHRFDMRGGIYLPFSCYGAK